MKIYFACGGTEQVGFIKDNFQKANLLISAYHWNTVKDKAYHLVNNTSSSKVIIDSGAFSVWKSNKKTSLNNYLEFIGKVNEIFKGNAIYVNLDVIPGVFGRKPSKKETEEACEKGYENYLKLKKHKLNIMPVHHQYDDIKWLHKYAKHKPYVLAISPANDRTTKGRIPYLDECFRTVKNTVRCHGLAVTGDALMKRYPWFSVDSASWTSATGLGVIYKYEKGKVVSYHQRTKKRLKIEDVGGMDTNKPNYKKRRIGSINAFLSAEKDITEIWKRRGVTWNE
tara:strand:- start:11984 stop:12829 length:846 start_codon:yes stop_codon:yes gene_type:complete